ncbi:Ig-like domain-containing domain [Dyadobacter sandarakinus]|uniref:Ig-like domain-containing protein n=1 Tax=Dyadobacter sandarakinus TaxID=2747268 RepID=A0ABX7ID56_9BACT|nr:Ig-like domain-containing protein [Dyadobacter sandarakinus]QRR02841.1 Ig-like domain-containing protein [Dyadobacter sandarakinus]
MFRTFLIAVISLLIFGRCAQQVTPTGGKKDSIPPGLLESNPVNKTLNFKGKVVELFFDEYVIVDNINQKLVITPEADNPYSYKLNGQSVRLTFKNEFKDSTTYTLNFGDAIKDFAEKNPAKNLKVVFSTGATLDSGRVYGTLKDIRTSKPIFDALVGLYNISDTLDIAKQKPYYFSRTDSSGNFSIENVQTRNYRLIAVDDKNRNMLYNAKDERVGFLNNEISAGADSVSYLLDMFLSDNTPLKVQRTLPRVNNYAIVFNKSVERVAVNFVNKDSLPYLLENPTTLKFFNVEPHPDSTIVKLTVTDSLGASAEFDQKIAFQAQRGKERQRDPFSISTEPESNKPLTTDFRYKFVFNKPVKKLGADNIVLITDSLTHEPLSTFPQTWNATHNELVITAKSFAKDSVKWDLPKGSIISVEGDTLPKTLFKHPHLNEENYGQVQGRLVNADPAVKYIVELIDEQFKVIATQFSNTYTFRYIPQGKYQLRATQDLNGNGRWDTGEAKAGLQPEPIFFMPDKFLLKANFELNDINIILPKNQ